MSVSCGRSCRRSIDPDAPPCEQCGALRGDSPDDEIEVELKNLFNTPGVSVFDENWSLMYAGADAGTTGIDGRSVPWKR